ncbi:MAG: hypothetical protein ACI8YQ_003513 [Polaribacter sp.]|jgi:hypothetical protein
MGILRFSLLLLFFSAIACKQKAPTGSDLSTEHGKETKSFSTTVNLDSGPAMEPTKGALLLTRFKTLDELKKVIQIKYFEGVKGADPIMHKTPSVRITHASHGRKVVSNLRFGVSERDISSAWTGGLGDKIWLGLSFPYLVFHKRNLPRVFNLSRRRAQVFGEGDMAFYDLAETMVSNINDDDLLLLPPEDLSEKGYLNTFNHMVSQAFITSIFSEKFADFIADSHERAHMPELITGTFTEEQLKDLEKGAIDNYVDIINNEWGQELGKVLGEKYAITKQTNWTPELLANYLNDLEQYFSWSFQIGFKPFRAEDELVITFAKKINTVMNDVSGMRWKKKKNN